MNPSLFSPRLLRCVRLIAAFAAAASAFTAATAAPEKWVSAIESLTKADRPDSPAKGGVVFVGSSSIVKWTTLAKDFPGVPTLNRGFGGSELADSVFYFEKIVAPYQPRAIVLYAGENDIAAGASAEKVAAAFEAFRAKVRAQVPAARLFFISIKPSPSRAKHAETFKKANALIAAQCARDPLCTFVDIVPGMLKTDGQPDETLFVSDRLHMNAAGYAIWTKILAPLLKP